MPSTTTTPPKAGDKMYGLVIEEFKKPYKYREDLTVPQVGPKEVLIEIRTAGYCHTEAMVQNGEFAHMMQDDLPLVPSHEPTGVIAAIGEEAAAKSADEPGAAGQGPLKVGERVSALTCECISLLSERSHVDLTIPRGSSQGLLRRVRGLQEQAIQVSSTRVCCLKLPDSF